MIAHHPSPSAKVAQMHGTEGHKDGFGGRLGRGQTLQTLQTLKVSAISPTETPSAGLDALGRNTITSGQVTTCRDSRID